MAAEFDLRRQVVQRVEALRRAGVAAIPRYRGDASRLAATASPSLASPREAEIPPHAGEPASRIAVVETTEGMPMPRAASTRSSTAAVRVPAATGATGATAASKSLGEFSAEPSGGDSLDALRRDVAACTRCRELACTRTQTVFGVGDPRARLCFLGEAPGADEDRRGEPFVGRAGQLLDRIIEACTLKREDVYILNILKCRPPGNRNPEPDEAANCRAFLDRQLALIRPEFICCLGAVAAKNLLGREDSIGKMRGRAFDYRGAQVVCTYHPAYLLRNPSAKRDTWEDMQLLMKLMGIALPGR